MGTIIMLSLRLIVCVCLLFPYAVMLLPSHSGIRLLSYLSMVTMVLSYLSMATVFWIRDLVSLEQDLDLVGVAGGQDELLSMQDCGDWDTIEHQVALILDTHGVQSLPLLILAS